jgi:hypothetical protein
MTLALRAAAQVSKRKIGNLNHLRSQLPTNRLQVALTLFKGIFKMTLSDGGTFDYMTFSPPSELTSLEKRGLVTSDKSEAILP